jgi:hypothetical protein
VLAHGHPQQARKSRPNSLSSRQLRTFTPSAAKIVEALDLAIDLAEVGPKS